jgi:hypothetical protein
MIHHSENAAQAPPLHQLQRAAGGRRLQLLAASQCHPALLASAAASAAAR